MCWTLTPQVARPYLNWGTALSAFWARCGTAPRCDIAPTEAHADQSAANPWAGMVDVPRAILLRPFLSSMAPKISPASWRAAAWRAIVASLPCPSAGSGPKRSGRAARPGRAGRDYERSVRIARSVHWTYGSSLDARPCVRTSESRETERDPLNHLVRRVVINSQGSVTVEASATY
jgi:hypothetical protein